LYFLYIKSECFFFFSDSLEEDIIIKTTNNVIPILLHDDLFMTPMLGHLYIGPVHTDHRGYVLRKEETAHLPPKSLPKLVNAISTAIQYFQTQRGFSYRVLDGLLIHSCKIKKCVKLTTTNLKPNFTITFDSGLVFCELFEKMTTQMVLCRCVGLPQACTVKHIAIRLSKMPDNGQSIFKTWGLNTISNFMRPDLIEENAAIQQQWVTFILASKDLIELATRLQLLFVSYLKPESGWYND